MLLRRFIKKSVFHLRCISSSELINSVANNKPIEWHDLIKWFESGQKYPLWRNAYYTQRYVEHQASVAKEYRSINDFIRIRYLKWDVEIDKTTEKRIAIPGVNSIREPLLTPNAFPYYLASTIDHWLIWCDPKPNEPDKIIQQVLNREFHPDKFERFYFINPPRLRSISDVFHAHVFTRAIK